MKSKHLLVILGLAVGAGLLITYYFKSIQKPVHKMSTANFKKIKPKRMIASFANGEKIEQNGQVFQEIQGSYISKSKGKFLGNSTGNFQQKIGASPYDRQVVKNLRTNSLGYLSGDVILTMKSSTALRNFKPPGGFTILRKLSSTSVLLRYFDPRSILTARDIFMNHPDIQNINIHVVEQEIVPK